MRQYNSTLVTASWTTPTPLGTIECLDGRINGSFASLTKDNGRWIKETDGNGNATRVFLPNKGGTLSLVISASSPTNALLSRAVSIDEEIQNVVGVMVLRDLSGDSIITLESAYLVDWPDLEYMTESRGDRTWVWDCERIIPYVGSHNVVGSV